MKNDRQDFIAELDKLNILPENKQEIIDNYDFLQSKKGTLKGPWAVAVDGNTVLEGNSIRELQDLVDARSDRGDNSYMEQIVSAPTVRSCRFPFPREDGKERCNVLRLYRLFRSSTAYRVRIALHLKGLAFESVPVNILKGEHKDDAYRRLNPAGGVPVLEHDGFVLGQSLAILNYIDNLRPDPPLAGGSIADQAFARQVALTIATEVHPLVNMKVLHRLESAFHADEAAKTDWKTHWAAEGMGAVETLLRNHGGEGPCAMGDAPGLIDLCLVPQMYFMRRNRLDVGPFPICRRIESACVRLPAFLAASPEMQKDAPADLEPIHGPHFKGDIP